MKPLEEHKCNTCFYQHVEGSLKPCKGCSGYDKYLPADAYFEPCWEWTGQFGKADDLADWLWGDSDDYDVVEKPKHYMLFEDEGIEVRDVIKKLTEKIEDSEFLMTAMCYADYVQMMQYLMRFMDKNGVEDLKKARWYLDKLIGDDLDANDT